MCDMNGSVLRDVSNDGEEQQFGVSCFVGNLAKTLQVD